MIRLQRVKQNMDGATMWAIVITEENLSDVVAYICRHGGTATGHNGDTASGYPARIRIKMRNYGEAWGKLDWRVARVGDIIVRADFKDKMYAQLGFKPVEFWRMKAPVFDANYTIISKDPNTKEKNMAVRTNKYKNLTGKEEVRAVRVTLRNYLEVGIRARKTGVIAYGISKQAEDGTEINQRLKVGKLVAQLGDYVVFPIDKDNPKAFRVKDEEFKVTYARV